MAKPKRILRHPICLCLDMSGLDTAIAVARDMRGCTRSLSLGPSFFLANGPAGVRCFFELGIQDVILDLRLLGSSKDIWNYVTEAAKMGTHGVTINTLSGTRVIKMAVEAAEASKHVTMKIRRPYILVSMLPSSLDNAELVDDLQLRVKRRGHVQHTARQVLDSGADGMVVEFEDVAYVRRVSRKIPLFVFAQRGPRNYMEVLREEDKALAGITEVLQAHASHVMFDAELVSRTDVEWSSDMISKETEAAIEGDSNGFSLRDDLLGASLRDV